ncbi:MAG TPA: DUF2165 domain-containing protein [Puia sp.]|nr:DUF2165 domain-containing protein [Puia sp.]
MYSAQYLFRVAKIICVAAIGLMSLLVVVGNTTDYYTNYDFVQHVLKMDTIFPGSKLQYRSIHSNTFFHLAYLLIILTEAAMAICCIWGTFVLCRNLKKDASSFNASKNWAVAGIILGILIWFIGFEVIGGEWFAMWQSAAWNGLASAERILSFLVLTLMLLHLRDE